MDYQQMNKFAASSSSTFVVSKRKNTFVTPPKKFDVFLSFRGEDTRDNFTSHLHAAMDQAKVETYIDNRLEKGDEISQALIKAIQDSHVSVVIFSENYASSKWCLNEITKILECKRDHGQIVIPVFYKVDPSDVRKQTGSYKEAFAKHDQDLKMKNCDDKLQKWRCALTEAANLAGWDYGIYRNESIFIKDIVKDVLRKLISNKYPIDLKGVVGIKEYYASIECLLEIGSTEDVRVIGIWGMGGIGKTTLARSLSAHLRAFYEKYFLPFESYCFLENVREQSKKKGLVFLRNKLHSELLVEKSLHDNFVTRRLQHKKALIVLDDVATSEQLDYLISDCLAPGSRVIVTTRDKHIFRPEIISGIYEVKGLRYYKSLKLFYLNVFGGKYPEEGYEELSKSVIAYCKGNPLALKVLGARLQSRSIEVWKSELRKLYKIPDADIHNVLKLSFDGLDRKEQAIFLDIACFLKGESRDDVTSLLDACGFFSTAGIENLIDKCLLTVSILNEIQMHDLIQEMGWEIVRQESITDPGRRSRLWDFEEVYDVLKNDKGTEAVEGIVLNLSKIKELHLSSNSFTKMTKIRILKFFSSMWCERCKIYLRNGVESLSDNLRHFEWHGCCLESLPSNFCAEKLVKLIMPGSRLKKLWEGVQNLENLKEINLRCSKDLVKLPDLSQATNLEVLCLNECISLREVHPSILSSHKLQLLDLDGCTKIESLESDIHVESLRKLNLTGCYSLKKFSVVFSKKSELKELRLDDCVNLVSLPELPPSLQLLSAINCTSLQQIDFIQLLPVVHISFRRVRYPDYILVPGAGVPKMFRFCAEGDSITFPRLPQSGLCGFICCLILPHIPPNIDNACVKCYINKVSTSITISNLWFRGHTSISDHVLLCSTDKETFFRWKSMRNWACGPHSITFECSYENESSLIIKEQIKRCGVFPVYSSQEQTITTVSTEVECKICKRKAPSFKKEESSRSGKHIIRCDIDLNQTIEVSEGEDLSGNQVDNCSDLVMFEKSHTLMEIDNRHLKPDRDPIAEVESILCDSYKLFPMSTHSTCISQSPNVKAILEKLETLLDTSLEIISSYDEIKQQFLHLLEQLGQIQDEVPVRLHPLIDKLKNFIEVFYFRFATAQKLSKIMISFSSQGLL